MELKNYAKIFKKELRDSIKHLNYLVEGYHVSLKDVGTENRTQISLDRNAWYYSGTTRYLSVYININDVIEYAQLNKIDPLEAAKKLAAHEIMHAALGHFSIKYEKYNKRLFNIAGDLEINCILGIKHPGKIPEDFGLPKFLDTESYYELLLKQQEEEEKKKEKELQKEKEMIENNSEDDSKDKSEEQKEEQSNQENQEQEKENKEESVEEKESGNSKEEENQQDKSEENSESEETKETEEKQENENSSQEDQDSSDRDENSSIAIGEESQQQDSNYTLGIDHDLDGEYDTIESISINDKAELENINKIKNALIGTASAGPRSRDYGTVGSERIAGLDQIMRQLTANERDMAIIPTSKTSSYFKFNNRRKSDFILPGKKITQSGCQKKHKQKLTVFIDVSLSTGDIEKEMKIISKRLHDLGAEIIYYDTAIIDILRPDELYAHCKPAGGTSIKRVIAEYLERGKELDRAYVFTDGSDDFSNITEICKDTKIFKIESRYTGYYNKQTYQIRQLDIK